MPPLTIRAATPADIPVILRFVRALALYENAEHEVLATPDHVQRTLFCDQPKVFGLICEQGDTPLGFAVYFFNYSTWQGRHGLYLEDLYVAPEHRGQGAGMALLQHLAQIAVAQDCGRFEWSVLDWNEPAIGFYRRIGAVGMHEWTVQRLEGEALHALASHDAL